MNHTCKLEKCKYNSLGQCCEDLSKDCIGFSEDNKISACTHFCNKDGYACECSCYNAGYEAGRSKTTESFKKALEKHYTQVIADSLFESIKTFIEEEIADATDKV